MQKSRVSSYQGLEARLNDFESLEARLKSSADPTRPTRHLVFVANLLKELSHSTLPWVGLEFWSEKSMAGCASWFFDCSSYMAVFRQLGVTWKQTFSISSNLENLDDNSIFVPRICWIDWASPAAQSCWSPKRMFHWWMTMKRVYLVFFSNVSNWALASLIMLHWWNAMCASRMTKQIDKSKQPTCSFVGFFSEYTCRTNALYLKVDRCLSAYVRLFLRSIGMVTATTHSGDESRKKHSNRILNAYDMELWTRWNICYWRGQVLLLKEEIFSN